jgi:hypothetical protein
MKTNLKALAALALVLILPYGIAQTSSSSKSKKKPTASEAAVQAQIDALRNDMQSQIQSLKQQLSEKDAQLQQAQQAAAAAQAAAQQAQQAAQQAQQANTTNTEAVTSLQGAVTDLKTNNASIVQTVQDSQKQTAAKLEHPDAIYFKGITLSPTGSYLAAETVWRSAATGAGLATPFSSLPLQAADAAHLSEFFATAQQSRIALLAEGKTPNFTLRGYYEADFLSAGNSANSNQSNSYSLRQRQLWAQASTPKWMVTGGQMWSLATEYKPDSQLAPGKEQIPQTIDPNYNVGFTWERQYGFRASMNLPYKTTLALSVENPELLNLGGTVPNFILVGGPGATNLDPTANYTFNLAPDLILKASADPGFGHFEAYGIGRFFHARTYTSLTPPVNAYNTTTVGGGIGGSARVSTFQKKLDFGLKGLWGDGISRYGDSTLSDATANYAGQLKLLHGYSAMGTIEAHATPRLDLYFYYGTDGVFRNYSYVPAGGFLGLKAGTPYGYGNYSFNNTGCFTEPLPGGSNVPSTPANCAANNRDVQEITFGYWYDFYKGPMGRLRQGFQYSYATRNVFSGLGATPQATDSMFWTSFRYYLP